MGGVASSLLWHGDPDAEDPVSGLSKRDIHLVRKSWAPIYKDVIGSGHEILTRLFRASPSIKGYFYMVRDVPDGEMLSVPQFKAHCVNLMTSINSVISQLDSPDVAQAMCVKIGTSHAKRKIKEADFEVLKDVLVILLQDLKVDKAGIEAWGRTVAFMYKSILPELRQ